MAHRTVFRASSVRFALIIALLAAFGCTTNTSGGGAGGSTGSCGPEPEPSDCGACAIMVTCVPGTGWRCICNSTSSGSTAASSGGAGGGDGGA